VGVLTGGNLNSVGYTRAVRSPALCTGIISGRRDIGAFGGIVGAAVGCR